MIVNLHTGISVSRIVIMRNRDLERRRLQEIKVPLSSQLGDEDYDSDVSLPTAMAPPPIPGAGASFGIPIIHSESASSTVPVPTSEQPGTYELPSDFGMTPYSDTGGGNDGGNSGGNE
jgi:hypothetical protein